MVFRLTFGVNDQMAICIVCGKMRRPGIAVRVVTTSAGGNWHSDETVGVDDQEFICTRGKSRICAISYSDHTLCGFGE